MEMLVTKPALKFILRQPRDRLDMFAKCLNDIWEGQGDIVRLSGTENIYRYKFGQYRLIFHLDSETITVTDAATRTNIKYRRLSQ
ncbi:hypothetical protein AGMMS49992_24150 [Clostridia bacterium]|nr:hypothetical protein AGMMS49992_24150 [Clostridia bacterium]